jgi:hypothetical protein
MTETIPKALLTFYRCPKCQAVFALTWSDTNERQKLFGGLWCIHYHGETRLPLQEIAHND